MDVAKGSMSGGECPMGQDGGVRALLGRTNKDWWPEMLATEILNPNGPTNPHGEDFDYAEAFKQLDYWAVKEDLKAEVKDIEASVTAAAQKNEKVEEAFLARRFRNIARMAPDILDVVVAMLANPLAGLGIAVRKIAEKAKEEAK